MECYPYGSGERVGAVADRIGLDRCSEIMAPIRCGLMDDNQVKHDMLDLKTNAADYIAAVTRVVGSAIPVVGGLLTEVITQIIPKQKIDRLVEYLKIIDQRLSYQEEKIERFKAAVESDQGSDLFEEGMVQASRALSDERRYHLANLITHSLTKDEISYSESKKLLNLYSELTDPELIILVYYSKYRTIGHPESKKFMEKHREILYPVDRTTNAPQRERDRGALQDSYIDTLRRLKLIDGPGNMVQLTDLGRLFLKYIQHPGNEAPK